MRWTLWKSGFGGGDEDEDEAVIMKCVKNLKFKI